MTEKRFTFDEDINEDNMYELGVFFDKGESMETTDILNRLNNLHEENEQLKQKIKELEDENQMMKDTILLCKETIEADLTYREMQDNLEMILWNVITDD